MITIQRAHVSGHIPTHGQTVQSSPKTRPTSSKGTDPAPIHTKKDKKAKNTPPSAVLPRREPQSTYGTHTPLAVSDAMWRAVRLARAARASGSGSSGSSGSGGGDGGNSSATAVALANGDAYHARCRYHNCYAMLSYRYRDRCC